MIRVLRSSSAVERLPVAGEFVSKFAPGTEILLVGASRDAVDDLARVVARSRIATFGLHRLSLMQLAARIALLQLAESRRTPASRLGGEAVAARAAFEALNAGQLKYFAPVERLSGPLQRRVLLSGSALSALDSKEGRMMRFTPIGVKPIGVKPVRK